MLRYLRENTGNWIIKIFLGIIVVVFVFLGVGSFGSKRTNSVAMVNDEPITMNEYQQAYKAIVEQMQARFGKGLNDDLLKMLNVKQQALDTLIDQKLVLAQADKLKIIVSKEELQNALLSFEAFQKDGRFNLDQYKKVLGVNAMNPEIFEENQRISLRQQKVRNLILSSVTVSDLEARNWFLFENTKTAVDYILFDPNSYSDIQPDDEQIKTFYSENKENYKSEATLKAVYLQFSPEDFKDLVKITDEQIKTYYEEYTKEFSVAEKIEARHILIKLDQNADDKTVADAKRKAEDIYKKARDGDDFEALAKQFSEDPSKESGGYLGKLEKDSIVKPFGDKAFSMKPGEISEPVRTQFGWHIINVMSKSKASTQTLAEASETIEQNLKQEGMKNIAYDKAGEAFDAVIDGDDFEQVALISNKKLMTTQPFDITGKGLNIEDNEGFAKAAFELPQDDISDVKQLGNSYYLIKPAKKVEPAIQELDLVKDRVKNALVAKLQKITARQEAELFVKKAREANTLTLDGEMSQTKINSTELFTRKSNVEGIGNSPDFIQACFALTENKKVHPEVIETPKGYYIIGFKEHKLPEESEIIENIDATKRQISWTKQTQSYQAWIGELRKQSRINYDSTLLN